MKIIAIFFCVAILASCKKENCKSVTIKIINGCENPYTTTTMVTDRTYCDEDLEEVRKLAGYKIVNTGGGSCGITTLVIEK